MAFISDSAVKFEQSADAGATWTDVSDNYDGTALCTNSTSFGNGNTATDQSINRQHRITIDCVSGKLYCQLAKIMLYISTNGATNCQCKVEFGDKAENTVWTTDTTMLLNGFPGWNVINVEKIIGTEYISWSASYRYVRLTFSISGITANAVSNLEIQRVRFISKILYNAPSVMAYSGAIYAFDSEQNAVFPKNLSIQGDTLKIGNTIITETQLKALLATLT